MSLSPSGGNYWRAVSELISYSSSLHSHRISFQEAVSAPACSGNSQNVIADSTLAFTGSCAMQLDGKQILNSKIKGAIVRYEGGDAKLSNVEFVECYFLVRVSENPSPLARKLTDFLLKYGNSVEVTFP